MPLSSPYPSFLNVFIRNPNYVRVKTLTFPIKDFGNDAGGEVDSPLNFGNDEADNRENPLINSLLFSSPRQSLSRGPNNRKEPPGKSKKEKTENIKT